MAKITGIGGIFFKSKGDPKALAAWYETHLGLSLAPWGGAVLRWPDDTADDNGLTVWHVAASDTKWFAPSEASFMINYRVDNLAEMLANLQAAGGDDRERPGVAREWRIRLDPRPGPQQAGIVAAQAVGTPDERWMNSRGDPVNPPRWLPPQAWAAASN